MSHLAACLLAISNFLALFPSTPCHQDILHMASGFHGDGAVSIRLRVDARRRIARLYLYLVLCSKQTVFGNEASHMQISDAITLANFVCFSCLCFPHPFAPCTLKQGTGNCPDKRGLLICYKQEDKSLAWKE